MSDWSHSWNRSSGVPAISNQKAERTRSASTNTTSAERPGVIAPPPRQQREWSGWRDSNPRR